MKAAVKRHATQPIGPNAMQPASAADATLLDLLEQGERAHREARPAEALAAFRAGMERFPADWRFPANAATVLYGLRRFREALALLANALRLDPAQPVLHHKMAGWLFELGNQEAGLAVLERSVAAGGDNLGVRLHLGSAYLELKDVARARAIAEEAVRSAPREPDAHLLRAFVLEAEGRSAESAAALRRVLELDPANGQAHYHLARAGEVSDPRPLERLLQRRELCQSSRYRLHFALGTIHDRAGAHEDAWRHFTRANRLAERRWDAGDARQRMRAIAAACTRERLEARVDPARGGAAPIFLVGMPRTGSSLLEEILAAHPRVHAVGEHARGIPRLASRLLGFRPGVRAFPDGLFDLTDDALLELARAYLASLSGGLGEGRRPVDKLLANFQTLGMIALLFPDARILDCRRDPRDCGLSAFFLEFQRRELAWSYDLESIARYYEDYDELMRHWREHLPLPILAVPYEELVRDPEAWTRRVLDFCGLDPDPACLAYRGTERPVFTASTLAVRERPHTRAVARWRAYEGHLGPLARLAGGVQAAERAA